ncbi:MAG: AAA-like domain-containing protein [Deltaproteobacteria bacterium]|nr:AAA-like domain-containing protein [Deltaproteobacteria bacterium]
MKFFTTEGPVNYLDHYCLPPLERFDLDEILDLIGKKKYFILHAPRQTGKTSSLLALTKYLNQEGTFRALYANIEGAQAARENLEMGMTEVVQKIARSARDMLGDEKAVELAARVLSATAATGALEEFLTFWCATCTKPTVLMLDEVDALIGDTLISLLRQLRAGYPNRPVQFPQSVILCGVRDIRDYRIHSSREKTIITGGSAFNVKAKSLRMGDFTEPEVSTLLNEHTRETGQAFETEAEHLIWELTNGQPWLVNALAYEACFEMKEGKDRSHPITPEMILDAKERLIQNRVTHLDQLSDKLREPRVRRIVEPMLAGLNLDDMNPDDLQYVIDLGLCRLQSGGRIEIANPVYREVLPRTLAFVPQASLPRISPTWLKPDGSLNIDLLLESFLAFWRQHGEPLLRSAPYHEIAPHLVLMAFMHRVVNGGGTIDREYAIGSGRMDLCIRYGKVMLAIELKVWRDREPDPLAEGLEQIDGYLKGLSLNFGWLVVFDRRSDQPRIRERTCTESAVTESGRSITVIRG